MTIDEARAFAHEWIAAWNSHDLDRILSHYAPEIVLLSPNAEKMVGHGRVVGLPALSAYWKQALGRQPTLRFEFVDVRLGYQALTILYRNHRGQQAAETLEFGADGKAVRSFACFG
jgi:ketosteroid isomerase-like protein